MTEPPAKDRRPWPMTWVAVAIAVFITLYTVINFQYRKSEDPHLPYEEAQERKSRFFEFDLNGWKSLEVASDTSASASRDDLLPVRARPQAGRLDQDMPMDLVTVIPRRPKLVGGFHMIEPFMTKNRTLEIVLVPETEIEDPIQLEAYLKEGHLVILAVEGEQTGGLEGSPTFRLGLTAEEFPTGPYSAELYTDPTVYEWTFTVD
ncbi:MAG: hypothetical protein DRP71_14465 [Verrucomicrobia bacterium]|nr:MAG: hypothetical protein DRP71_14465 [Verrucomicrobiota bacterium]